MSSEEQTPSNEINIPDTLDLSKFYVDTEVFKAETAMAFKQQQQNFDELQILTKENVQLTNSNAVLIAKHSEQLHWHGKIFWAIFGIVVLAILANTFSGFIPK